LNRIIGVEGIKDPMIAIVVSAMRFLHFVSYPTTLTALGVVGLNWWRLGFSVLYWIGSCIFLGVGNVSCIVGDVTCGVSGGVGWRVGCGISSNVGSGVDLLHHFVFTSSLFSHGLKGTIVAMSLARVLRSAVHWAPFFDLGGGNVDMGLKTPYCRSVLELT
jgi:hypothetical protein